jgi:hypothetical protein
MDKDKPADRLVGPFTAEKSSTIGYQIISGDGAVAAWVVGETNVRRVVEALNRSYEEGEFN